jgi:hypothetical protein
MAEEDHSSDTKGLTSPERTTPITPTRVLKIRPTAEETKEKQATLAAAKSSIKSLQSQQARNRQEILDQIERNKEARRQSRAASKIRALPVMTEPASTSMTTSAAALIQRPRESRLRIQTPKSLLQHTFAVDSQLAEVVSFVEKESGSRVCKLETRVPKHVVWEEAQAVIGEDAVRDRGLERTLEDAVGLGSVVLVATFSTIEKAEVEESLI